MKTTAKIVALLTASASAAAQETIETVEQTNTALAQSFGLYNDQELAEST